MMISPASFADEHRGKSFEELIMIKDELMREIKRFENDQVPEEEYAIEPNPETRYSSNLEYMVEISKLIQEAFQKIMDEDQPESDPEAGIALVVEMHGKTLNEKERAEYAAKIRALRDIPDDFIVFDFENPENEEQFGLHFYQMCISHDNVLRTEIKIASEDGERMFSRECSTDNAIDLLYNILDGKDPLAVAEWDDVTEQILGEEYPGIPKREFDAAVAEFMENSYWKKYYENAPTELCKEYITMEFYSSEYQTPEAEAVMGEMEEELALEDWKYLLKYCGNNPRKTFILKKIDSLKNHYMPEKTESTVLDPKKDVTINSITKKIAPKTKRYFPSGRILLTRNWRNQHLPSKLRLYMNRWQKIADEAMKTYEMKWPAKNVITDFTYEGTDYRIVPETFGVEQDLMERMQADEEFRDQFGELMEDGLIEIGCTDIFSDGDLD